MSQFTQKLDEILNPHFTDGKGVVYSKRLDKAKSQILSAIRESLPEEMYFDNPTLAEFNSNFTDGYNQALTEVERQLLEDNNTIT